MVINWLESSASEKTETSGECYAAEYVRMSTEHQKYSTDNQAAAIRNYAEKRGYKIVRTYSDEGKSGLRIEGREGLQNLLHDIEAGTVEFSALLVYDVSRWGRFQDPDEAASYELRCRQAGVQVHYCAEQFENDGSIGSSIIKTVKRAMAGEYSRELSVKVFAGQANLIRKGFRQGGVAGYGLRRMLIDQDGKEKGVLEEGEHKSIATDRVVLVPGPNKETEVIEDIFRSFVEKGMSERQIADSMNRQGISADGGRPWSRGLIHGLLINEKYIGNNVWAKTSCKLKGKHTRNEPGDWVRADGAFPQVVQLDLFSAAQEIIRTRSAQLSDEEMLARLSRILADNGTLSGLIIDEYENAPSSSSFRTRFGSLLHAYALVGFKPDHDYRYLEINRKLRALHPEVLDSTISGIVASGGEVERDATTDLLTINREFTASVLIVRCIKTSSGSKRWKLRFDAKLKPDLTIAVRMESDNTAVRDYLILPQLDMREASLRLSEYNGLSLDAYRFDSLQPLYEMAARSLLRDAA